MTLKLALAFQLHISCKLKGTFTIVFFKKLDNI